LNVEVLNRRHLLAAAGATGMVLAAKSLSAATSTIFAASGPTPMIHVTDLFRPHGDPDDHWDLACVFALAMQGRVDLKAVLIDSPFGYKYEGKNPDIAAVAQMNYITSQAVPAVVGSPRSVKSRTDTQPQATKLDHSGIDVVLKIMEQATQPVIINVIGSCRDVAVAARKRPELFHSKCRGIYLNAGNGDPDAANQKIEWNVGLEPAAYAAMFDIPCPIYWMPCINGTYYNFRQDAILPHLSDEVQNYFAYMFARKTDHNWLAYLTDPKDQKLLGEQGGKTRNMWCTAGFFHAAGQTVLGDGKIVDLRRAKDKGVFAFEPCRIECDDAGRTKWTPDPNSSDRFIFRVRDKENYGPATTVAMKSLLTSLP
jgi:hypothetical protein